MSVKLTLSLLLAVVAVAQCASILDYLNIEDAKKLIDIESEPRNDPTCKWKCKGPACACCIEQNITSFEPEGAKCVHLRYLSKDEGLFMQISHGKKIEYQKIQTSSPEPLCMVLSVLFQMCATFSHIAPTPDGLQGCVNLEPGTIFLSQRKVPLGCFNAREDTMEIIDPPIKVTVEENEDTEESEDIDFDPNKFFAGVYQTAQQSLALLTSLLETPTKNGTTTKPISSTDGSSSLPKPQESTSQRRVPKNLKHPNQL